MLVPLSWLQEYVDISNIPLDELRKKMSACGLAVERQHSVGEKLENIVIGEIINLQRHPDSNHLWVCQVNIGQKIADRDLNDEILQAVQIVTGAPNIFEGAKVPVVLPGGVLPDGTKIESSKLRGYDSQGMMCSERELGLGEGHEGILILDNNARVGESLVKYLCLPDIVFDVEITANRGDLLSIVGIAREIATLFNKPLLIPETRKLVLAGAQKYSVDAEILNSKRCNRFVAAVFDEFDLKPSPIWMQQRLIRSGMRPINNLVDITNYVMLEIGQPTHAYDASQVKDHSFIVRDGKKNEKLQTLDGKIFELTEDMLVVADREKALGLAGIMGGESSKITRETKTLVLEAANFDPVNIRRTGMKLNIRTDAIIRFERGVDSELGIVAMERINALFVTLAGAHLSSNVVDVYPGKAESGTVTLGSRKLAVYLGEWLDLKRAELILNGLGFKTVSIEGGDEEWQLSVSVPSWRSRDISIEEDLIEEVTRIYGYDNLTISTPKGAIPYLPSSKKVEVKKRSLNLLKGMGYQEVLTYSFNSKEQIESSGYSVETALEMANPLSEEQRYLRMSLLPNLLWTVERNKYLKRDLLLFELSSVYHHRLLDILPDDSVSIAFEPLFLSGLVAPQNYDFDAAYSKVISSLDALMRNLRIASFSLIQDTELLKKFPIYTMFHPGRVAGVSLDEKNIIGLVGEIHPHAMELRQLKQPLFLFELEYSSIVECANLVTSYKKYSTYPETKESLSFILSLSQQVGGIVSGLKLIDERILSIEVGKPYKGDQIEEGKKAITFTFIYQSMSGPIKDKDATEIREKIIEFLVSNYSAVLRKS